MTAPAVDPGDVAILADRARLARPTPMPRGALRDAVVAELTARGWVAPDIAVALGTTKRTVARIRARNREAT